MTAGEDWLGGSGDHPDLELIADYDEGLLSPEDMRVVGEHVGSCPRCGDAFAALTDVRTILAQDSPGPMPDVVAARIDAALAGQPMPGHGPEDAPAPVGEGPAEVVSLSRERERRKRILTALSAAAAAAVLFVGIGYMGWNTLGSAGGDQADDLAVNQADTPDQVKSQTEREESADSGAGQAPSAVQAPPATYTEERFAAEVRKLIAPPRSTLQGGGQGDTQGEERGELSTPQAPAAPRAASPSTAPSCLAELVDGRPDPIAIDRGTFEGRPATIVVLPDPDDDSTVIAYALGPGCDRGDRDLLHRERVAK